MSHCFVSVKFGQRNSYKMWINIACLLAWILDGFQCQLLCQAAFALSRSFWQSLNDLHTLFSLQAEVLSLKTNAVRSLPTRESWQPLECFWMVTGEGLIWDMLLEQSRLCYKGWGTSNGVFALSDIMWAKLYSVTTHGRITKLLCFRGFRGFR